MKTVRPNFSHIKVEGDEEKVLCGMLYTTFKWWETAHSPNDDYYFINKGNYRHKVIKTTGWNHPITGQGYRYVVVCPRCWEKYEHEKQ